MSLFGSLVTGASALNAQSKSTSIIANNIANATTTGFKRSEAAFYNLVADESFHTTLNNSVTVNRVQRVDQPGAIRQTSSLSEASILGNGLFAVKQSPTSQEFLYTRNGAFDVAPQSTGEEILRNSAGHYLFGWALNPDGSIAGGNDLNSLVPIDISVIDEMGLPTTAIRTGINLDAEQEPIDPHQLALGSQQLPVNNEPAHFVRNFSIFDNLGNPQSLTVEFRRIIGPMAHFSTDVASPLNIDDPLVNNTGITPNISNGDSFNVSSGGNTLNISIVSGSPAASNEAQTIGDLLNLLNNSGFVDADLSETGQIIVRAEDPTATIDISSSSAAVLSDFNIIPDPVDGDYIYAPETPLNGGSTYPNQGDFPTLANTTSPNTRNWWEVTVLTPEHSPSGKPAEIVSQGLINFDGNGNLNTPLDANGNSINPLISLSDPPALNFDDSTTAENLSALTIDIGAMTQAAGLYTVIFTDQNGAPMGERTGIEITRDGTVRSLFSNGATADIFRLPLINFNSPNLLQEVSQTAYAQTQDAGELRVLEAGIDGAGFFAPSTIETSNVDFADEFSDLIVSQRAFTAGSQLMRTVDEMTERLGQLSR
jgi:flagellar hook protein FlgE